VDDQLSPQPDGLSRKQLRHLRRCADDASAIPIDRLLVSARNHVAATENASRRNPLINLRLARAICDRIEKVMTMWASPSPEARFWLGGAINYFTISEDDESDHLSPIGFEDDAEVLNACLRFANLPELCLKVEDYDHA
jgi:hypothetical protein